MTTLAGLFKKLFRSEPVSCLACGDCCRQFSWHLKASDRDLERWRQLGREDLLASVNELGWLWHDPETKERLPVCPYLVETSDHKAQCGIHEVKPDICRNYPTYETRHQCIKGIHIR
jgi:Fe-S-cluster containining protein